MGISPRTVKLKVKGGGSASFTTERQDEDIVLATFKARGKDFKSVPKGFLAIDPNSNLVYTGFDADQDGIINVKKDSFAQHTVQIAPFSNDITASEKLANQFSSKKSKGKMLFKPKELSQSLVAFEAILSDERLSPSTQLSDGDPVFSTDGAYTYTALINDILSAGL